MSTFLFAGPATGPASQIKPPPLAPPPPQSKASAHNIIAAHALCIEIATRFMLCLLLSLASRTRKHQRTRRRSSDNHRCPVG